MLIEKLEEFPDYELLEEQFEVLFNKFEAVNLHPRDKDPSLYFRRLFYFFDKMQSAEEAYKLLYFFYYLLVSYQATPGSRAALQLTNTCEISFEPIFQLLEEKNSYEENPLVNLKNKELFFDDDCWYIQDENGAQFVLTKFLRKCLPRNYLLVDTIGQVYFAPNPSCECIKTIKPASLNIIQFELLAWYVNTIKKIQTGYDFITNLPLAFFKEINVGQYDAVPKIITALASQLLEEEKEYSQEIVFSIKDLISATPECLNINFIIFFVEHYIPFEERYNYLLNVINKLSENNTTTLAWFETLDLETANKVLSYIHIYNLIDVKWLYFLSPKLRLTNFMQIYAEKNNLVKDYTNFNHNSLPGYHLSAYERYLQFLEKDTLTAVSIDDLMIGETYLLNTYRNVLANKIEREEKQEFPEFVKFFYLPTAVTMLVNNEDKLLFSCQEQLKNIINKADQDNAQVIFCGIASLKNEHYTPFLIFEDKIVCVPVRSGVDSLYEAQINLQIARTFGDLFPNSRVHTEQVTQSLNKNSSGFAALSFMEYLFASYGTQKALVYSQNENIVVDFKNLPLNFNRFSWDKEGKGCLYYSPLVNSIVRLNTQSWIERLKTYTHVQAITFEGDISLDTIFTFQTLNPYEIKKYKNKFNTITLVQSSLLATVLIKIDELHNSSLPSLSLNAARDHFFKTLEFPNQEIIQIYSAELTKKISRLKRSLRAEQISIEDYVYAAFRVYFKKYYRKAIEKYFIVFMKEYMVRDLDETLENVLNNYFTETRAGVLLETFSRDDKNAIYTQISSYADNLYINKKIEFAIEAIESHLDSLIVLALDEPLQEGQKLVNSLYEFFQNNPKIMQIITATPRLSDPVTILKEKTAACLNNNLALYSNKTLAFLLTQIQLFNLSDFLSLNLNKLLLPQLSFLLPTLSDRFSILSNKDFENSNRLRDLFAHKISVNIDSQLVNYIYENFQINLNRLFPATQLRCMRHEVLIQAHFDKRIFSEWSKNADFESNPELYTFAKVHINELLEGQLDTYLRETYAEYYSVILNNYKFEKCVIENGQIDTATLIFNISRRLKLINKPLHGDLTYSQLLASLYAKDLTSELRYALFPLNVFREKLNFAFTAIEVICNRGNAFPSKLRLTNPLTRFLTKLNRIEITLQNLPDWLANVEPNIDYILKEFFVSLMKNFKKGFLGTNEFSTVLRLLLAQMFGIKLWNKEKISTYLFPDEAKIVEKEIFQKINTITLDAFQDDLSTVMVPSFLPLQNFVIHPELDFLNFGLIIMKWHEFLYDKKQSSYSFLKFYDILNLHAEIKDENAPLPEEWCKQNIRSLLQDEHIQTEILQDPNTKQFINLFFIYENVINDQEQKAEVNNEISITHLHEILNLYQNVQRQENLNRFLDEMSYPAGKQNFKDSLAYFKENENRSFINLFSPKRRKADTSLRFIINFIEDRHHRTPSFLLDRGDISILEDLLEFRWKRLKSFSSQPNNYETLPDPLDRVYLLLAILVKSALKNFNIHTTAFELLMPGKIRKGDLHDEIKDDSQELCIDECIFGDVVTLPDGRWLNKTRLLDDYRDQRKLRDHFTKLDLSANDVAYLIKEYPHLQKELENVFISLHCHLFDENIKQIFLTYLEASVFREGWDGAYTDEHRVSAANAYERCMASLSNLPPFTKEILFKTGVPHSKITLGEALLGEYSREIYPGLSVAKVLWRYYPELNFIELGSAFISHKAEFDAIKDRIKPSLKNSFSLHPNEEPIKLHFLNPPEHKGQKVGLQFS